MKNTSKNAKKIAGKYSNFLKKAAANRKELYIRHETAESRRARLAEAPEVRFPNDDVEKENSNIFYLMIARGVE